MLTSSRAIVGDFYRTLATVPPNAWHDKISMPFDSDQEAETYPIVGQAPAMREWRNERLLSALREDKITIHNVSYEASFRVPMPTLRRDKTGQYRAKARDLAARAGWQHWNKLLSTLISNGAGSTYGTAYDGQYFFDTDHSLGYSGTIKNDLTSSEAAGLNVGTAAAPTSLEAALAILDSINYMRTFTDDQGELCNEDATGFVIMAPANLAGAIEAACNDNTVYSASSVGQSNPLKSRSLQLEPIMNARLTTTTVFYIFRTDGSVKPFINQSEQEPVMNVFEEGSEFTALNDQAAFMVKASRNVGYGEFLYAARCTLS